MVGSFLTTYQKHYHFRISSLDSLFLGEISGTEAMGVFYENRGESDLHSSCAYYLQRYLTY